MKFNLPLFIVFEGIDGSGKTTLSEMLYNHFLEAQVPAVRNQEPSDGYYGKKIRKMLQNEGAGAEQLLKLFIKDREDDVKKTIMPALKKGKAVITDRYYFSNAAYQGAMGISPLSIIEQNRKKKFPEPDRVYLIDIDPETALERISGRNTDTERDIFEKKDFLSKVRDIYGVIIDNRFIILDGAKRTDDNMKIIKKDILQNFCIQ